MRVYTFWALSGDDNMDCRIYRVRDDGWVTRYCVPSNSDRIVMIRQRIPRVQCAREMQMLRNGEYMVYTQRSGGK